MNNLNEVISIVREFKSLNEKYRVDITEPIKSQLNLKPQVIKRGINQRCLTVDDKPILTSLIYVSKSQVIKFQGEIIDLGIPDADTRFDKFVSLILDNFFDSSNLESLTLDQKNKFNAFIIEYFSIWGYDTIELTKSVSNQSVMYGLEEFYRRNLSNITTEKNLKKKELVENLISYRDQEYESFEKIISNIIDQHYNLNSNDIFQDCNRLFNRRTFMFLVKPILSYNLDLIKILEKIIKSYKLILASTSPNEKIEMRSAAFREFLSIEDLISPYTNKISLNLKRVIDFFKDKSNEAIGFSDTGEASISIIADNRTYNFDNSPIYIHAYLENIGTGIAQSIKVVLVDSTNMSFMIAQDVAEILTPKEKRLIRFKISNIALAKQTGENLIIYLKLQWSNNFDRNSETEIKPVTIKEQQKDLPWEELRRSKPYDIVIVDDPNKLFGRDKLIEDLRWNIEKSHNITSYIIYGQKRVGKSSIVKTLETIYKDNQNIIFIYKVIADLKNVDANRTFLQIGESISKILKSEFRQKSDYQESQLPNLNNFSFNGSLSPLLEIIDDIRFLNPNLRVIIALDEFDELNRDFFANGELGKTFALNIGKSLNVKSYIGFILIGSENMVSRKIQGMRLNTFDIKKVDTFDKTDEYDEYCKIISEPAKSCLTFSPEVLDHLYFCTNGNPYFTNMVCRKIFLKAFDKKISFIDIDFIKEIIDHMITDDLSAKDFEHFWKDGLSEEDLNYEKELDKRKRLLTAFAQSRNENKCDWNSIKKKIRYPKKFQITESQMEDVLNEFKQRKIIFEDKSGCLAAVPKLFEEWLLNSGLYQIIVTLDDKDEIMDRVLQEQKLFVTDDELRVIVGTLEDSISKNQLTNYRIFLDQFEDNANKRWIADFLKKTVVISSSEIIEYIKKVRKDIWSTIEVGSDEYNLRKDAEIFCLPDSYEQNRHYAELIKKTFQFSGSKTIKHLKDLTIIDSGIKKIIVYEPLIDCPFFYRNELSIFLKNVNPILVRELQIHIICFVISDEAKNAIDELISTFFGFNYKIHVLKTLQRSEISPFYNNTESINNPTFKVLSRFDKDLSDDACLVKIGQIIPYQCFPILWCSEIPKFLPLINSGVKFDVHKVRMEISAKLKNLQFESETDKIEFKASFSEPAYNWKKICEASNILKKLPPDNVEALNKYIATIENLYSLKLSNPERIEIISKIKHSVAKNISAFANSHGGEIYVGIEDDFTIQGLIYDMEAYKSKEDIRRAFSGLIEKYIGLEHANICQLEFITLPNSIQLLKIIIAKAEKEIWVKINEDGNRLADEHREIYIREHHGARQLFAQQFFEWKNARVSPK